MNFLNKVNCAMATYVFGYDNQKNIAIEELSELIKEITKDKRGQCDREHLLEELCDVEIMIQQLKYMYMIQDDEHDEMLQKKLNRLDILMQEKEALDFLERVKYE